MKKISVVVLVIFFVVLMSQIASAGYLVTGAKIVRISNTANNQDVFTVVTMGGTGPCSNAPRISFPSSAVPSQKVIDRAIALAISAITTGYSVDIYNFNDDSCDGASFIDIQN